MQLGPQIECRGCTMPILLSFTVPDGADRRLTCPCCGHAHRWVVVDVRDGAGPDERTSTRSSVE